MTHQPTDRELGIIAEDVVLPGGVSANSLQLCVVQEATLGDRLPTGDFSGLGGVTQWGVAWFDGLKPIKPYIHVFPEGVKPSAASRLISIIKELTLDAFQENYRRRVAEALAREEAEASAAAKDAAAAKKSKAKE